MKTLLNDAIIPLLNEGYISSEKLDCLIEVKEFVDRISNCNYLSDKELAEIYDRVGEYPRIITWGDYFQSDLSTQCLDKTDEEISVILETIKFDMLASYHIFYGKELEFADWVDASFELYADSNPEELSEEEQEIYHLKILKDYFFDLKMENNFTESEIQWFYSFRAQKAM